MRIHQNCKLAKLECNLPKIDVSLSEENRSDNVKILEGILTEYIDFLNKRADEDFIELYPEYKNSLRDEKIQEIQKIQ